MRLYHALIALASLTLLLTSEHSHAEASTPLDTVLERALELSPEVGTLEAQAKAEVAAGVSQATLENPEVDAEYRDSQADNGEGDGDEVTVTLGQPLRLSHLGLRDRINHLIEGGATLDRSLKLLEFAQSVRLAYVRAWAAEARLSQIDDLLVRSERVEKIVKEGSTAGLYGKGEAALFKAESLKLQSEKRGVESDLARARAELTHRAGFAVPPGLIRPDLTPISIEIEALRESSIPALERAKLVHKVSAAQTRLAKLDAFPRFVPRLVYEHSSDGSDYYGVGLSIPLPLWDRNQGERLKAEAQSRADERALHFFEGEGFTAELSLLREALNSSIAQASDFEGKVVPSVREALAESEALLHSGQGSVFQLWQTLKELSEVESRSLELWVKAEAERSALVLLLGREV